MDICCSSTAGLQVHYLFHLTLLFLSCCYQTHLTPTPLFSPRRSLVLVSFVTPVTGVMELRSHINSRLSLPTPGSYFKYILKMLISDLTYNGC